VEGYLTSEADDLGGQSQFVDPMRQNHRPPVEMSHLIKGVNRPGPAKSEKTVIKKTHKTFVFYGIKVVF
jgi:hypothetical protein